MKNKVCKRILSLAVCLCLVLGILPGTARAEQTGFGVLIDGAETIYDSYYDAVATACAAQTATLTLYQDADERAFYTAGVVTVDLNGHSALNRIFAYGCVLTVTDSSEGQGVVANYAGSAFDYCGGKLILQDSLDLTGRMEGHEELKISCASSDSAFSATIGSTGTEDVVLPEGVVAIDVSTALNVDTLVSNTHAYLHTHKWEGNSCIEESACTGCSEISAITGHSLNEEGVCTACGFSQDLISIKMTDSYGDSWNGNGIEVYEDGVLLDTATIEDGESGEWSYNSYSEKSYSFRWVEGDYADECSFTIAFGDTTVYTATTDICGGLTDGEQFYPVCEHSWNEGEVVDAGCVSDGYTLYTCQLCGRTEQRDFVSSLGGHQRGDGEGVVTAPTCANQGYTTYICTVCGTSFYDDYTTMLSHTLGNGTVTEPDCEQNGYTTYLCGECGEEVFDDYTAALGHRLGADGSCTVCGEQYSVPVWVTDVQICFENMADVLGDGKVSYDPATNTLTLNGFVYDGDLAAICTEIPLNIILRGENAVTTTEHFLYASIVDGEINLNGTGSLEVECDNEFIDIGAWADTKLTAGGSLSINVNSNNNEGFYLSSEVGQVTLVLKDKVSVAIGSEDNPIREECIYLVGSTCSSLTVQDDAEYRSVTEDEEGIYVGGAVSQVTISGNASVYVVGDEEAIDANNVTITGGTVTAIGGENDEGIYTDNLVISGGVVYAEGGTQAIDVGVSAVISGGVISAVGKAESSGFYVEGNLTVTGGSLTAYSEEGYGIRAHSMKVTGGVVRVTKGGLCVVEYSDETGFSDGSLTVENGMICTPEGAAAGEWEDEALGATIMTVLDADNNPANQILIVCGTEGIKYQLSAGASAEDEATDLRLISFVDTLEDYSKVVFAVSFADADGVQYATELGCTTAYTELVANGVSTGSASGMFGEEAKYFVTYTVNGWPQGYFDTEITVTMTRYDLDGKPVSSEARVITISDAM